MTGHPPDNATQFTELPLDPAVQDALMEMGFEFMTPIQQQAIPILLDGYDFLGQAPTGTGKTAAFGVPLINKIVPNHLNLPGHIQALVIGPTRELVQQITEELNAIGEVKGVKTLAVFGGESVFIQKEKLRDGIADIVVGTPGRLIDFIEQYALDFSKTRMVVLDEADEMLDMGFREDIEKIIDKTPRGRQTCLFSATVSSEIRAIADRFMMYPQEVRIQPQDHNNKSVIEQFYFIINDEDKPKLLKKMLIEDPGFYGIVFCQTKKDVADLTRQLRGRDYVEHSDIEGIHGALPQHMRDDIMEAFRQNKFKMLVATDVLARGIDIDKLTHIINAQPPGDPESYIHRIGRTARAGESGVAITLFTPYEREDFERLERRVGMDLKKHPECHMDFAEGYSKPAGRRGGYGRARSGGGKDQPRNKARRHPSGGSSGGSAGGGPGGSGGRRRSRGGRGGGPGGNRGGGGSGGGAAR